MRERISACILTYNEERKIRRCLKSVAWCDEIVVLDSFSTDRTIAICREFTDRVYQFEWLGYVAQRNKIRELAAGPWILSIDADEEVSPGLRTEIEREFEQNRNEVMGYEFPRQVYYIGRWIRHGEWFPDFKLRLFRKVFGRSEGEEPHDRVVISGVVKRLKNPLWHYTYDDLYDHVHTLNRFSTIGARQKFARGQTIHWHTMVSHAVFRFLKAYALRGGFRDGMRGFIVAVLSSFGAFLKYAKMWELAERQKGDFREFPDEV
ncbi:MAG: glycosyltransferase family 2 protein [Kiritimatiellia bacterium]